LFEWPEQLGHDYETLTRTLFRRREKQRLWLVVLQTPNYIVFHVNISLLDRLLMQVGHTAADDFIVEVEVREPSLPRHGSRRHPKHCLLPDSNFGSSLFGVGSNDFMLAA
jgi:hypothetical protein